MGIMLLWGLMQTMTRGLIVDQLMCFRINNTPTNIVLSSNSVNENKPIGTRVGLLITTDVNENNVHTYSLVSGTGVTDNALFTISNDTLYTQQVFNYKIKNAYNIRIQTNDSLGGIFEKSTYYQYQSPIHMESDRQIPASRWSS